MQGAAAIERGYALDDAPCFAPIASGVHCECAADSSRNSGHEFGACKTVQRGEPRELGTRHTGFNRYGAIFKSNALEDAMRKHDRAAQAAITHKKIAPEADHVYRFMHRQRCDEAAHVVKISRYISAISATTGPPTRVPGHRFVHSQFTGDEIVLFGHVHLVRITVDRLPASPALCR